MLHQQIDIRIAVAGRPTEDAICKTCEAGPLGSSGEVLVWVRKHLGEYPKHLVDVVTTIRNTYSGTSG